MAIASNSTGTIFCEQIGFVVEQCCDCGVPFAMSRETNRARKSDGAYFYCPNGHPQHYTDTTESQLRRQVTQAQQKLDQAQADAAYQRRLRESAEADAAKAQKTTARLKKRAAAGVCHCCNRQFADLYSHMTEKHPGEVNAAGVRPAPTRRKKD